MAVDDWTAPTTRATNFVVTADVWNTDIVNDLTALFNAMVGDASADAALPHLHKNGTFAARPGATSAMVGRTYLCTDVGLEYICLPNAYAASPTHVWYPSRHIPALCDHFSEDFVARPHGTTTAAVPAWHAAEGWQISATVTTDTGLMINGPVSLLQLLCDVQNDNNYLLSAQLWVPTANYVPMHVQVRPGNASASAGVQCMFGWGDSAGSGATVPNNFIGYIVDPDNAAGEGVSTTWYAICRQGSVTRRFTNTTVSMTAGQNHLFEVICKDAVTVQFYVDGAQVGTDLDLTATPVITDMSWRFRARKTDAGATDRSWTLDHLSWWKRRKRITD